MLEQGLDQALAAVNLDLGPVLALELRDVLGGVPVIRVELFQSTLSSVLEGDVLAGAVELIGDRALVVGPVRGEDLIGPTPEQGLVGTDSDTRPIISSSK